MRRLRGLFPAQPTAWQSWTLSVVLVGLWGFIRLVLFRQGLFPVTYVLPLLACVWTRDRRALWAMAAAFGVMVAAKSFWLLPVATPLSVVAWPVAVSAWINIAVGAALVDAIIGQRERLDRSRLEIKAQAEELGRRHAELRAREERIVAQNEELQSQAESLARDNEILQAQHSELETQNEELRSQAEEIEALNHELSGRERVLDGLLDATRALVGEHLVHETICSAALQMIGREGDAAVVVERSASGLALRAQTGLPPRLTGRDVACPFAELAIAQGKALAVDDMLLRPDLQELRIGGETCAMAAALALPLRGHHAAEGALVLVSRSPRIWAEEQFRVAGWLSTEATFAMDAIHMQAEVARQSSRFRLLTHTAADLLAETDLARSLRSLCSRVARHLACEAFAACVADGAEGLRRVVSEGLDDGQQRALDAALALCSAGGSLQPALIGSRGFAGSRAWTCQPLNAANGRVVGCLLFGSRSRDDFGSDDLSLLQAVADQAAVAVDRGLVDAERSRIMEELRRSNEDLEQFAYVTSHDLKEPMRMVTSFTSLLSERFKDALGPEAAAFIGFANEGATRMQVLVDDLLAYSRVGRESRMEPVDMTAVLAAVKDNLRKAIDDTGAVISAEPLPVVMANPVEMLQVLQNLVANGIKFHRVGERPHIRISSEADPALPRTCRFCVSDNGIGIARQYHSRLFAIFQRLHTASEYPGTGVGLAICKKIVERHGGRIWLESQEGQGASFRFTLPLAV